MEAKTEVVAPPSFGRLEPLKVRDYWVDEAQHFTPWLAQEENLTLLGETLGLSLELVGTEQRVGPFKADIIATDGDNTVIVENQLDATDHKHLGQLMVYAAGRRARTVVWVAKQVTDEYRKVIDWLNEETSVNFWALEIELWRIGDSLPAPKFNVVCEPNELTKPTGPETSELTETKLLQLEFWKGFSDYLEQHSGFSPRKAQPHHWYDLPIGTTRALISLTAVTQGTPRVSCQLYIRDAQAGYIFDQLQTDQGAIESELGELEWEPLPDRKACRIVEHRQASLDDREAWPELFAWMCERAEAFKNAFAQRVKDMQLPAAGEPEPAAASSSEPVSSMTQPHAATDGSPDPVSRT